MNDTFFLSIIFGGGVLLQSLLLINIKKDWKAIGGVLLLSFFSLVPGKRERVYNPLSHVFFYFIWFSFVLTGFLHGKILPRINEQSLLLLNIVLWYAIASTTPVLKIAPELLAPLLIATILTLAVAIYPKKLNLAGELASYFWFLIISASLLLLHFTFGSLRIFFDPSFDGNISNADVFFSGMSFFILCSYLWLAMEILPKKRETWKGYPERMKTTLALVAAKHGDEQIRLPHALSLFCGLSAFFFLNYFYHWFSPGLLISIVLLIVPNLTMIKRRAVDLMHR